jgi:hypothetical protein
MIDDISPGVGLFGPKRNQGVSETGPVFVFTWKEERKCLFWWAF